MVTRALKATLLASTFGAAFPAVVYALDIFGRTMWGQVVVLALCSSYILLLGTAACERFDACSINTLLAVAAVESLASPG